MKARVKCSGCELPVAAKDVWYVTFQKTGGPWKVCAACWSAARSLDHDAWKAHCMKWREKPAASPTAKASLEIPPRASSEEQKR